MYKFLRRTRVIFALLVFVLITASFLNFTGVNVISKHLLNIQFIPAFVSIFSGGTVAFIILMLLTLLFGRVYCSFLCPLGIMQDIISKITIIVRTMLNGGKVPKSAKRSYKKPHNILRYTILVLCTIVFIAGVTTPFVLLDPYSNYGTIVIQLFSNIELFLNNVLSSIFPTYFYYVEYTRFALYAFIYAIFFFTVVLIMSMFKGRLYCNTICPVGSFLGLISGFSLFKPAIKKDMCVKCTACSTMCKSDCINLETKEIDTTRCVACYNCMVSCKRGGVELVPVWNKKKSAEMNAGTDKPKRELESVERRNAFIAFGALAGAIAIKKINSTKEKLDPTNATGAAKPKSGEASPIAPPGARSIEEFKNKCTGCHACIAACPNKIIKPAVLEYGLDGFMLPTITYDKKFCKYDCNACSSVCPHHALEHLTLEQKQKTQIGKAKYIAKQCIIFADEVSCGACAEKCPVNAIEMTGVKDKEWLMFPKLNRNKCIGCGACQNICPASPKALIVDGNTIQKEV